MVAHSADAVRAQADSKFNKIQQRENEMREAMQREQAQRDAVADKTARLRALRLAKEAAERQMADGRQSLSATKPDPKRVRRVRRSA